MTYLRLVYSEPSNSAHPGDLYDGHRILCYIEYCVLRSRHANYTGTHSSLLQFIFLIRKEPIVFPSYNQLIFSAAQNQ